MTKLYDVVIAGAGPVGLFLACELGLRRASVLVLERDASPHAGWKGWPLGFRSMNTPSVEAFYRRGLLGHITDPAKRKHAPTPQAGPQWAGTFAGIMLDASQLDLSSYRYRVAGPSFMPAAVTIEAIETALGERAESLGVEIRRGAAVEGVTQDAAGVTAHTGDGQAVRARWLVGCDGAHSAVRGAAGFAFDGTEPRFTGYVAQVDLAHAEALKPGFQPTPNGMYIFRAPNVVYVLDFDGGAFSREAGISREHLQALLRRVSGCAEVEITKLHQASSFTDRSKQATSYRQGRVLLAGDAAHIHPPLGGQGLNVGLGDAVNLGWKLAEVVGRERGGEADLALLDSYQSERHPVAAWVLEWNRAQVLALLPDLYGAAMKTVMRDLIGTRDGMNLLIDRTWGLTQRYKLGEGDALEHPLVGSSVPDLEMVDGSRLGTKMEGGKGLLIDFEDGGKLKQLVASKEYGGKVEYVGMDANDRRGLRAVLVRPDGFACWVAAEGVEPDQGALEAALARWFGHEASEA